MVKTLLEETIFQHVTIHKLMIYIYSKMKMSHDPLLAVIRTNILELKNMARSDPLVLIASSKTVLKTLLNFTRLTCISKEALHFIRRLMHDVYARMRRMWEMYNMYGAYEKGKKIKGVSISEKSFDKENVDTKLRQKRNAKMKSIKKRLLEMIPKNDSFLLECKDKTKTNVTNKNDMETVTENGGNNASELPKDDSIVKESLLDRIRTIFNENNERLDETANNMEVDKTETNTDNKVSTPHVHNDLKNSKKRKIKKWSLGIFQAKRKKRSDHSSKPRMRSDVKIKPNVEAVNVVCTPEVLPDPDEPEDVPEIPDIPDIPEEKVLPKKDFEDDENSIDKCDNIIKDAGWGERFRAQREYYLNEMSKVTHRLSSKPNIVPKYDFINKLTDKLGVSISTSGYALKELMVMDRTQLLQPLGNATNPPQQTDWVNMEGNTNSATVAIFKATRSKKRFIYECLGKGCSMKTTQLQALHNHATAEHKPLKWDWNCSICGAVQQINLLKNASTIDMAMYHLIAFHSTSALKRNPVELEFTSLDIQIMQNKIKMDSPLNNQTSPASTKNSDYCSQLYKCPKCSFSSGLFTEAFTHFSVEIKEFLELMCVYCFKNETNAQELCEHLESHHASSIFLCSECHYRSVSLCNTVTHHYDQHENFDENKEILIYVNSEPFGIKKLFPTFVPANQLNCYVCKHPDKEDYATLVTSKFMKHVSTCPNQGCKRGGSTKKFECCICGTKVAAAYRLKQHYETHQIALYTCLYCGQAYGKLSAMKEHLSRNHMEYYPRFVIREDYDECSEEIATQYSSIMRFETDLEALVEVAVEMEDFQTDNSRIKLQTVSGDLQKLDNFFDKLHEVNFNTKLKDEAEQEPDQKSGLQSRNLDTKIIDLTDDNLSFNEVKKDDTKLNSISTSGSEVIEIYSDSEETSYSQNPLSMKKQSDDYLYNSKKTSPNSSTKASTPESTKRSLEATSPSGAKVSSAATISSDDRVMSTIQGGRSFVISSQKNIIKEQDDDTNTANSSLTVFTLLDPPSPQIITGTPPQSPNLPSCSYEVDQQILPETSTPIRAEPRIPEIRVIAEAKMDNFRKSLPAASNLVKLNNLMKTELPFDLDSSGPSYREDGEPLEDFTRHHKTVPNILSKHQAKPKNKMIQIHKLSKKNDTSNAFSLFTKCPYCNYKAQDRSAVTQHITRLHVDVINLSPTGEIGRNFTCAKCQILFQAFASLHKHMEVEHTTDSFGVFRVYVQGFVLVRKNIKICFLCSTLIVSLEQLYKHPDVCPFAHTTGTSLNSSIIYATGKSMKTWFMYKKSDVKVNKAIVELLQPHLPTHASEAASVPTVKRAVAKKSTGPRPLPPSQESNNSSNHVLIKRAVAKKSTGPFVLSPSSNFDCDNLSENKSM